MNLIEPDEALIRPTAARYANRYRMVDREDIAQELRLWWLTKQKAIKRYTENGEERKLTKALQRAAERYCRQQKALAQGYRPEDEFFYSTGQVRELLPLVYNPELVVQDQRPDEGSSPKRTKPANEGNNLLAMVADVARALEHVDSEAIAVLYLHFGAPKWSYEEIAGQYETTVAAAKMRVHRAVQAVVDVLGGTSPYDDVGGPGARRSISNAHAQAITGEQYE